MVSSEVERTLVKSPPELWSELSNPSALARHLGELGEIRITRIEPEHAVEWEAGDTSGSVRIKPSGWGTKVTLTATRQLAAPAAPPAPTQDVAPEPVAPEPAPIVVPEPPAQEPEDVAREPEPAVLEPTAQGPEDVATPEPRVGLLRRLFAGRRRRKAAELDGEALDDRAAQEPAALTLAAIAEAMSAEMVAADPFSTPACNEQAGTEQPLGAGQRSDSEQPSDAEQPLNAEPARLEDPVAEELAAEEVTAVLTSVLDRLGAAHHRPFSRA